MYKALSPELLFPTKPEENNQKYLLVSLFQSDNVISFCRCSTAKLPIQSMYSSHVQHHIYYISSRN